MASKRDFKRLRELLDNPESKIHFFISGDVDDLDEASIENSEFLDDFLRNKPATDEEGAVRIRNAVEDKLFGSQKFSMMADYPIIARVCKMLGDKYPITCLMMLTYGHTGPFSHTAVSQSIYQLYDQLLARVEKTPEVIRAAFKYADIEYDLHEWKGMGDGSSLVRIVKSYEMINSKNNSYGDDFSDIKSELNDLIERYWKKHGSPLKILSEVIKVADKRVSETSNEFLVAKRLDDVATVAAFVFEYTSGNKWPFVSKDSIADVFSEIDEFLSIIENLSSDKLKSIISGRYVYELAVKSMSNDESRLWVGQKTTNHRDYDLPDALCRFISESEAESIDKRERRRSIINLIITLSDFIGRLHEKESNPIEYSEHRDILGSLFGPGLFDDVSSRLSKEGKIAFTKFIMNEHPGLSSKLPRGNRGRFLEDELGM
ncbi:hypothetical protein [Pseudomonas putida]|uniref:Uncharacterized protein n=1 Tax=Pseudomonas putida TaxID=303 RepID=A0A8I1JIJ2_PSEPU|nr:hypothetical protein [Pseudomonas putida]MBI6882579.1 hypothetical protein [Pseudomonas putida]